MSEKNLKERIEEIESIFSSMNAEEKKKKEKKFKLPFGKKVSTGQKKKNFVTVVKINENSHLDIKKIQIDDQTILEDGIPRLATAQYVFYFKKNPWIFLPSWSVEPLSAKTMFEKSQEDGSNTKGYKILMDKMQKEQLKNKKQMSGMIKWIAGLIILGIIGYAFISGGV